MGAGTQCTGVADSTKVYNVAPPLNDYRSCHQLHTLAENGFSKNEVDTKGSMYVCNADGSVTELSDCTWVSNCAANTCGHQHIIPHAAYVDLRAGRCATSTVNGNTVSVIVSPMANTIWPDCPIATSNTNTVTWSAWAGTQCTGVAFSTVVYNVAPPLNDYRSCHQSHTLTENGFSKNEVDRKGSMYVCNADGSATEMSDCTDLSNCAANTCGHQQIIPHAAYVELKAGRCSTRTVNGNTFSVIVSPMANMIWPDCPIAMATSASERGTFMSSVVATTVVAVACIAAVCQTLSARTLPDGWWLLLN